jgi:hypothetical protein
VILRHARQASHTRRTTCTNQNDSIVGHARCFSSYRKIDTEIVAQMQLYIQRLWRRQCSQLNEHSQPTSCNNGYYQQDNFFCQMRSFVHLGRETTVFQSQSSNCLLVFKTHENVMLIGLFYAVLHFLQYTVLIVLLNLLSSNAVFKLYLQRHPRQLHQQRLCQ